MKLSFLFRGRTQPLKVCTSHILIMRSLDYRTCNTRFVTGQKFCFTFGYTPTVHKVFFDCFDSGTVFNHICDILPHFNNFFFFPLFDPVVHIVDVIFCYLFSLFFCPYKLYNRNFSAILRGFFKVFYKFGIHPVYSF